MDSRYERSWYIGKIFPQRTFNIEILYLSIVHMKCEFYEKWQGGDTYFPGSSNS